MLTAVCLKYDIDVLNTGTYAAERRPTPISRSVSIVSYTRFFLTFSVIHPVIYTFQRIFIWNDVVPSWMRYAARFLKQSNQFIVRIGWQTDCRSTTVDRRGRTSSVNRWLTAADRHHSAADGEAATVAWCRGRVQPYRLRSVDRPLLSRSAAGLGHSPTPWQIKI